MESTNMEIWHGSLTKKAGNETKKAVPVESPNKSKKNASSFSQERKSRRLQMEKELKEPIEEDLEEHSVIKLPSMPMLAEADSVQANDSEMPVKRKSKKSKKSKKHSKRDKSAEEGQVNEVIDLIDTDAETEQVDAEAEDDSNVQQLQNSVLNELMAVSDSLNVVEQLQIQNPNDGHQLVAEKRKRRHHHHHHHHHHHQHQHLHQHLQNHQHQHHQHHHHHHHRHKHHHQHHHGEENFTMNGNLVHTTLPTPSTTFYTPSTMANNPIPPHCFNQKKRILEQWLQEQQEQERQQQQQLPSDSD